MNRKNLVSLSLALYAGSVANAQMTAANTQISNQASATFTDSAGVGQTSTSNVVYTTVKAVYQYQITPDESNGQARAQIQAGLAAQEKSFPFTITNTGNINDVIDLTVEQLAGDSGDFSSVVIYEDTNANGFLDNGELPITATKAIAMNGLYKVIVKATIPAGAAEGATYDLRLVGDSINITGTLDELGNKENTARAVVTSKAVLTSTKSVLSGVGAKPGETATFEIKGANVGGQGASGVALSSVLGAVDTTITDTSGIVILDPLPNLGNSGSQVTFLTGPATAVAGVTSYAIYKVGGVWTKTFGNTATDVGMVIPLNGGATFGNNLSYNLTFTVRIDNDSNSANGANVPAGTNIVNIGEVKYLPDPTKPNEVPPTPTNPANIIVGQKYAVAIGNNAKTVPTGVAIDLFDGQVDSTSVYAGGEVVFKTFIKNNGNGADTFTLVTTGSSILTNIGFYNPDGTSPLSNNAVVLNAGEQRMVVIKAKIPNGAASVGQIASVDVQATSGSGTGTAAIADDGLDTVKFSTGAILDGLGVDIVCSDGAATATDNCDAPVNGNVGASVYFPFEVKNAGQVPDSYVLTPSGVMQGKVYSYTDTNSNNKWDPGEPLGTIVTNTGVIAPGDKKYYVLQVDVPSTQPVGQSVVTVAATSATNATKTDSITATVNVLATNAVTMTPGTEKQLAAGSSVDYRHTITNTGNTTATVDVAAIVSPGAGFTYSFAIDPDGDGPQLPTAFVTDLSAFNLPAGGNAVVVMRVMAAQNVAVNTSDTQTITANVTFNGSTSTQTLTANDKTTVLGGVLGLVKSVDKTSAAPGEVLTYTVTATNTGNLPVSNVVLYDPVPNFTEFVSLAPVATTDKAKLLVSNVNGTWYTWGSVDTDNNGEISSTEWQVKFTSPLVSSQSWYVGINTDSNALVNTADAVGIGASYGVIFKVKVK